MNQTNSAESEKKQSNKYTSKTHNQTLKKSGKGFVGSLLSNLVGENLELAKYWKIVKIIDNLEPTMQALSDNELKSKTGEFRLKFAGITDKKIIQKKLSEILPEAFAVVREASKRTIKKRQFAVQLIGGMVLNDGRIAEMKTGEGKTFVAPLAAYLNALPEKSQVHIVTVNDYLARVGASQIGEIFDFLGMTVGVVQPNASFYFKQGYQADNQSDVLREIGKVDDMADGEMDANKAVLDVKHLVPCDRRRAYIKEDNSYVDIVYAVNSELGFDYLRDNMVQIADEMTQQAGHIMAIVDEVDSILIDEARTPLIISSQDQDSSSRYRQFAKLVKDLKADLDYAADEKRKVVTLTDLGTEKVERLLGIHNLYANPEYVTLIHHLDQALKAQALFHREKEYAVKDGEIVIVDEFTGRFMYGRRFSQGLHQALEAKEAVSVQAESKTVATITYQNFFRLYDKLSGMTGTAATESEELYKIYKLLVVTIPTNKLMIREDLVDKIFKTEQGKYQHLVRDIAQISKTGQPILIGTTSIDKNIMLGKMLTEAGIKHEILNAKNHEQEARIIASAGRKNSVTLATNIAGRGVDIVLGGNKPDDENEMDKWQIEHNEVLDLGGLFVIGTERHESRRIDNQLRGRAGRQGDVGKSRFYVSFEDYILRVFGGDKVAYYAKILPVADDEAIEYTSMAWLIEQAQKKIEGQNFDVRKHVTEYDDVINKQRTVIYAKRLNILLNKDFNYQKELSDSFYREIYRAVNQVSKPSKRDWLMDSEYKKVLERTSIELKDTIDLANFEINELHNLLKNNNYNSAKITKILHPIVLTALQNNWSVYSNNQNGSLARFTFLRSIDILWTEHLVTIDHLQDSTRLRYIAQKDPLTEFKEEGMKLFTVLLKEIDREVSTTVFKVTPQILPSGMTQYDEAIEVDYSDPIVVGSEE